MQRGTITYIRHFEQSSHQQADGPLKDVGALPADYGDYDLIICSPYRRCRDTAQLINAAHNRPILIDRRLAEYQGSKTRKSLKLDPVTLRFAPIPGARETWPECAQRLDRHYETVQDRPRRVLIVTHGVVVRYLQLKTQGSSQWARGRDVPFGQGFTV